MENTIPEIMRQLNTTENENALYISNMPDLIIKRYKDDTIYFIEVKYRKNGCFNFYNIAPKYKYENCYFVLISTEDIKCLTFSELKKGIEFTPKCENFISKKKEFQLKEEIIKEFTELIKKIFKFDINSKGFY